VQIVAWPADAPPLAGLDRLQVEHWKRADAGAPIDFTSQLFRKVPRSIMEAPVDGEQRLATYDKDGALWIIYREACGADSRACRPGTYCIIRVSRMPWKKAPDWAPDFSRTGEHGLFLTGTDPRWQSLIRRSRSDVYPDEYLQNGVIYAVVLERRDPSWPR
jgi:hypothetical protein